MIVSETRTLFYIIQVKKNRQYPYTLRSTQMKIDVVMMNL